MFRNDHRSISKNIKTDACRINRRYESKYSRGIMPHEQMEDPISSSQNFCLRLSEGSSINDEYDSQKHHEGDVIVISDSSFSASPKYVNEQKFEFHKKSDKGDPIYILDSSDPDDTDEDEALFQAWRTNVKHDLTKNKKININEILAKKKFTYYTSDETCSNSSEIDKRYVTDITNETDSTHVSITPQNEGNCDTNTYTMSNKIINKETTKVIKFHNQDYIKSSITPHGKVNIGQKLNSNTPKIDTPTKLTKKDTRNILKTIKSTRVIYDSSKVQKANVIINESLDEEVHPALGSKVNVPFKNAIIDETIDSDHSEHQGAIKNIHNNYTKKAVDKPDVKDVSVELSETKKKQISQWLMTTSPDVKSDSSFSIVPPSNRSSISSGNSSLERLEQNYETPNNRGRILKMETTRKEVSLQKKDTIVKSVTPKQVTLHNFMQKSGNGSILGACTPKDKPITDKQSTGPKIVENINIMDCADILDKLYGNVWRDKAQVLLPTSEPRKQINSTRNRAVQTERKFKQKYHRKVLQSDESDSSTSDTELQLKPTKKYTVKNTKRQDSFINDELSSTSDTESLYYTALTNPGGSTNNEFKPTPISATIQKAIEICDSDTEDENDKRSINERVDIGRRKLSFSDHSSEEHSSTSEYDPGDEIPPKRATKKESVKPPKQVPKTKTFMSTNYNAESKCTFLASLSESIPLEKAHPDAKVYRKDFKNNKDKLCKHLFKMYNEKVFDNQLPANMSIEWNVRMRGTAGFCYNKKSIKSLGGTVKSSRIVLATKVLDTPDRLRDTLIHEMCHAAAWLINDVSDGHGPFWTGWANKAMKKFPELPLIRRCHDYKIKTKFTYKCTGCAYSIGRHSKSLDIERKRCGHCYGKFELLVNKTTKSGTIQMQTPKRELSAFALFVKENYNSVKKERNAKHAEIMKVLGQQFSAIKIAKKNDNVTENNTDSVG